MIPQEDKNYVRSKNFSGKSGLVPGFTTIRKCTPECDGIVALHTDGKALQEEIIIIIIIIIIIHISSKINGEGNNIGLYSMSKCKLLKLMLL